MFLATVDERLKLMPGVTEMLRRLGGHCHIALDSTSQTDAVDRMLDLFEISQYFEVKATKGMDWDENRYGKMSKTTRFRALADLLGIAPSRCVVVGDAEKDIKAAHDAGMKVISVPNEYTAENNFSNANVVLTSLDKLTPTLLEDTLLATTES